MIFFVKVCKFLVPAVQLFLGCWLVWCRRLVGSCDWYGASDWQTCPRGRNAACGLNSGRQVVSPRGLLQWFFNSNFAAKFLEKLAQNAIFAFLACTSAFYTRKWDSNAVIFLKNWLHKVYEMIIELLFNFYLGRCTIHSFVCLFERTKNNSFGQHNNMYRFLINEMIIGEINK